MNARLVIAVLVVAVLSIAANGKTIIDQNKGKAGNAFWYRSVSFMDTGQRNSARMLGEIENRSNNNYSAVMFDLTVYDSQQNVIAVADIAVSNFSKKSKRPMKTYIDINIKKIASYKIDYSMSAKK